MIRVRRLLLILVSLAFVCSIYLVAKTPSPWTMSATLVNDHSSLLLETSRYASQSASSPRKPERLHLVDFARREFRELRSDEVLVFDPGVRDFERFPFGLKTNRVALKRPFENPDSFYRFLHREDEYDADLRHRNSLTYRMDHNGMLVRGNMFAGEWRVRKSNTNEIGIPLPKENESDGFLMGPFRIEEEYDRIVEFPNRFGSHPNANNTHCILRKLSHPDESLMRWPAKKFGGVQVAGGMVYSITAADDALECHSLVDGALISSANLNIATATQFYFAAVDPALNQAILCVTSSSGDSVIGIDVRSGEELWRLKGYRAESYDLLSHCVLVSMFNRREFFMQSAVYSVENKALVVPPESRSLPDQLLLGRGAAYSWRSGVVTQYSLPDGKQVDVMRTSAANYPIGFWGMWICFPVAWLLLWKYWNQSKRNWAIGTVVGMVVAIACLMLARSSNSLDYGIGFKVAFAGIGLQYVAGYLLVYWVWLGQSHRNLRHIVGVISYIALMWIGWANQWFCNGVSTNGEFLAALMFFLYTSLLIAVPEWRRRLRSLKRTKTGDGEKDHASIEAAAAERASMFQISTRDYFTWIALIACVLAMARAISTPWTMCLVEKLHWLLLPMMGALLVHQLLKMRLVRWKNTWLVFVLGSLVALFVVLPFTVLLMMDLQRGSPFQVVDLRSVLCALIPVGVCRCVQFARVRCGNLGAA